MKPAPLILIIALLVIGSGLLIFGIRQSSPSPTVAIPQSGVATPSLFSKQNDDVRLEIPASQMWVDTGIDTTGREVIIKYDGGVWKNHPNSGACDGEGRWPYAEQDKLIVPEGHLSALVGKTKSGTFVVGNYKEIRGSKGRLYLSINDLPGTYDDNSGSLFVTISLK